MSDFINGSPSDLKKLLFFHILQQKVSPGDLSIDKSLPTRLPGALVKVVPAPGGGVAIAPASYNGAAAGPGGPGLFPLVFVSPLRLLFFSSVSGARARGGDGRKNTHFSRSLPLSPSLLSPLAPNRGHGRQRRHSAYQQGACAFQNRHPSFRVKTSKVEQGGKERERVFFFFLEGVALRCFDFGFVRKQYKKRRVALWWRAL